MSVDPSFAASFLKATLQVSKIGICDLLDVMRQGQKLMMAASQKPSAKNMSVAIKKMNIFFFMHFSTYFRMFFLKLPVDSMSYDFGIYDDK